MGLSLLISFVTDVRRTPLFALRLDDRLLPLTERELQFDLLLQLLPAIKRTNVTTYKPIYAILHKSKLFRPFLRKEYRLVQPEAQTIRQPSAQTQDEHRYTQCGQSTGHHQRPNENRNTTRHSKNHPHANEPTHHSSYHTKIASHLFLC